MPASEMVALVTGIIGCASAVATMVPHLRKPLVRCCKPLVRCCKPLVRCYNCLLWSLENPVTELETISKLVTELHGLIRSSRIASNRDVWLRKVYYCEEEIQALRHAESSFGGLQICCKRYTIRKRISEIKEQLNKLEDEFHQHNKLEDEFRQEIKKWGYLRIFRKLFGKQTREVIEETLYANREISVIGVSGACGIGKTEVVAHVCKGLLESGKYNNFIWVEGSLEDDIKKLQMKIASKIGVSLSSDITAMENAASLRNNLLDMGKFVLVLDNLWKAFSLEQIGVPTGNGANRVIITSRYPSVCMQMGSLKNFAMKLLSVDEAYELLLDEITSDNNNAFRIPGATKSILKNVAEECSGLPLAVITVARYLRKLNWDASISVERALKKKLAAFNILKYMEDDIVANLMVSYERLSKSSYSCIQECFLYCAIYPRNQLFVAKELMEYWMWEGLLGEVDFIHEKLEEAEEILDELKDASLLENLDHENGVEMVKMHPLFWDMAMTIQSSRGGSLFFSKAGRGLRKPMYRDWPEDAKRVSLMRNDIKKFHCATNFRCLSTLLLQHNPIDLNFDDDFFYDMPFLKILDVSNTSISFLPQSLSRLHELNVLLLQNCWGLTTIPPLEGLRALIVLDVSGSPIKELPSGIMSLTELKRLGLSRTGLRSFPRGMICYLRNLQELLMIGCGICWFSQSVLREIGSEDVEDGCLSASDDLKENEDLSAADIEDVKKLEDLTTLEINFTNTKSFIDYISSRRDKLRGFKFCVGGHYTGKLGNNSLAFLKEFPSEPNLLPVNTLELLVMNSNDITHLTLPSFQCLNILDVSYCAGLTYLFKLKILSNLQYLEEIIIAECPHMRKVIEKDDDEDNEEIITQNIISLPRLRKLTLFNLPELHLFSDCEIMCDSVQTISAWNCTNLQTFPVSLNHCSIKAVRGERSWIDSLNIPSAFEADYLQHIFVEESPPEELISRGRYMAPLNVSIGWLGS